MWSEEKEMNTRHDSDLYILKCLWNGSLTLRIFGLCACKRYREDAESATVLWIFLVAQRVSETPTGRDSETTHQSKPYQNAIVIMQIDSSFIKKTNKQKTKPKKPPGYYISFQSLPVSELVTQSTKEPWLGAWGWV